MLKKSLFLIILLSSILRLANLGYSDFQGDEVAAQNYLFGEERLIPFLLSRTVGPMQYTVSYLANVVAGIADLQAELYVRLPFALAGVLTIFAIYKLSSRYFSKEIALVSTTLLSISGLYIAFSRIVQYQSFVILLSLIVVYLFLKFLKTNSNEELIYMGLLSGLGLLFHYDSLSFILPIFIVMLFRAVPLNKKVIQLGYLTAPLATTVGIFYIPFVLQPNFKSTLLYLANERIRSEFNYDSLYYSVRLMGIYHPKEYLGLLLALFMCLIVYLFGKNTNKLQKSALMLGVFAIVARIHNVHANSTLIYVSAIFGLLYLVLMFRRKVSGKDITSEFFIAVWFLVSFITYGLLFQKPLTHIYNFLTPAFILFGISLSYAPLFARKLIVGTLVVVGFISLSFNYQAFIDTSPEYPWNEKNYVMGTMNTALAKNQAIMGVFGFPYRRDWEEIGRKLHELEITKYKSNEKYRLSKYYIQGIAWDDFDFEAFVWVGKPQSFDRQPKPTTNILAEGDNYVIYRYEQPLLYDTTE